MGRSSAALPQVVAKHPNSGRASDAAGCARAYSAPAAVCPGTAQAHCLQMRTPGEQRASGEHEGSEQGIASRRQGAACKVQAMGSSSMHARTCGMRMHSAAASRYLHGCHSFIHPQHRLAGSKSAGMLMRCKHAGSAAARRARPSECASRSTAASKHMASVELSTDINCHLLTSSVSF